MSAKVAQKIVEVMKKVSYLKKDGNVNFKSTNYNFLSEEKVTNAVSKARAEVGLVILPIKVEELYDENKRSRVIVTYMFMDAESGESITAQMGGHGADTQDKALNKALTQAWKYLQRQTFGISTGDDPDQISSVELDHQEQERAQQERARMEQERLKLVEESKTLYKQLKGDLEGFDEFIEKLKSEGKSELTIRDFFTAKLHERATKQQ